MKRKEKKNQKQQQQKRRLALHNLDMLNEEK